MVFNVIYNSILVISSVLLVKKTGVSGENQRPAASQSNKRAQPVEIETSEMEYIFSFDEGSSWPMISDNWINIFADSS